MPTRPPISAREITDSWPAAARKTRDEPDRVIRVVDAREMAACIKRNGTGWAHMEHCINQATRAHIYLRTTQSGRTYAVCLYRGDTSSDPPRSYYSWASGHGYDRAAAALSGMPVAPGVVLTDHCGLDQWPKHRIVNDEGNPMRSVLAHRGSQYLPKGLFTL